MTVGHQSKRDIVFSNIAIAVQYINNTPSLIMALHDPKLSERVFLEKKNKINNVI